ncbi:hypothetical protein [Psychroserpens sp. SPM9]|uniref:hypothetical protein n=1 Tax=Psychroserpens sp. SPM9 TaxID=2975598 RepID=UPI0021A3BCEF|nr:hypothetical protein [Psychroserpens sp. SPM9]MDG5490443.1 hypothetical protein [Psychroserpens sp. SPM9]
MMKLYINTILIVFFFATNIYAQDETQNEENDLLIKSYLNLNDHKFSTLKKHQVIIDELYLTVKDSVKPEKINRRLNLFLDNKYNQKQLLITLKMERQMKGSNSTFELDYSIDQSKALNFGTVDEYIEYKKKLDSVLLTKVKIKDSTTTKKKN